jgi:hypothetical protein
MSQSKLEKTLDLLLDFYSKKTTRLETLKVENDLITILEEDAETKYQIDKEDPNNYYGSGEDPEFLKKSAVGLIKQVIQYCVHNTKQPAKKKEVVV